MPLTIGEKQRVGNGYDIVGDNQLIEIKKPQQETCCGFEFLYISE